MGGKGSRLPPPLASRLSPAMRSSEYAFSQRKVRKEFDAKDAKFLDRIYRIDRIFDHEATQEVSPDGELTRRVRAASQAAGLPHRALAAVSPCRV